MNAWLVTIKFTHYVEPHVIYRFQGEWFRSFVMIIFKYLSFYCNFLNVDNFKRPLIYQKKYHIVEMLKAKVTHPSLSTSFGTPYLLNSWLTCSPNVFLTARILFNSTCIMLPGTCQHRKFNSNHFIFSV